MHEAEQHVADHVELRARGGHRARGNVELFVLFRLLALECHILRLRRVVPVRCKEAQREQFTENGTLSAYNARAQTITYFCKKRFLGLVDFMVLAISSRNSC